MKVIVDYQGKVVQAIPFQKDKQALDKKLVNSSKESALKLNFNKRPKGTPNEIQFVKFSYMSKN